MDKNNNIIKFSPLMQPAFYREHNAVYRTLISYTVKKIYSYHNMKSMVAPIPDFTDTSSTKYCC